MVSEPAPGRGVLPAWPLLVVLAGFPLAWPLGLTAFAPAVLAVVMAVLLARRGGCRLLPGVAPLLLFVAWTVPCGLMVDSGARLAGWGLRQVTLAAVAIVVVYVTNAPERVTRARVIGALTVVWATVVVGGWLGVLAPDLTFTTPVGRLVPSGLLGNDLVHRMFVPTMAEVQTPWGAPAPFNRPAAPFLYANGWGAALVLLTPVTIATLVTTRRAWVRWSVSILLLASVVPAVASSNRGMFLGLGVSTVYVAVRLVARARGRTLMLLAAGAVVATALAVRLDVLARIADRQQYSTSTEGRMSLYAETWHRTLQSPLLGWGAPRPSLRHEVSVGTQGYVWSVMFSYGLVGLVLVALFLGGAVVRTWRVLDDTAILLHASLVGAVVIVVFYGLDVMQWLTIGSLAALLLRESADRAVTALRPPARAPVVTVS
ncbi:O-antigen ligase family protein [Nocardioides panacihumi]|uniref:O-antigen ligase family protein n=1 Tax=Nocardioides panacihumi TaxID=400774 RepID=UPI0031E39806